MRMIRGFVFGWFLVDVITSLFGAPLKYPAWVPLMGLCILYVVTEGALLRKETE